MKHGGMMKRILCMALLAVLLTMTAAPALASGKKPSGAYVVTTVEKKDRLYVRSSPGGSVKAKLTRGSVVVYSSTKNGWWKVKYRSGSGYVDKRYLTSVLSLPSAKYKPVDNLYVHSKPNGKGSVIGKLKTKAKVYIVKQKGEWVCISYKGHTGWVSAKYLKIA